MSFLPSRGLVCRQEPTQGRLVANGPMAGTDRGEGG